MHDLQNELAAKKSQIEAQTQDIVSHLRGRSQVTAAITPEDEKKVQDIGALMENIGKQLQALVQQVQQAHQNMTALNQQLIAAVMRPRHVMRDRNGDIAGVQ